MHRLRNVAFAAAIALSMGGCTWLANQQQQVTQPQSFQQSASYAYAQIAGLYNLLADLVQRGRISTPDAQAALRQIDEAKAALDIASAANDGKSIASITQGLIAIETTLKAKEAQR